AAQERRRPLRRGRGRPRGGRAAGRAPALPRAVGRRIPGTRDRLRLPHGGARAAAPHGRGACARQHAHPRPGPDRVPGGALMAAFRRRGRRYYEIEPVLPVTGPIGRLSARWTSRRAAEAVERALHELDVTGWSDLCRAVRERRIRVTELYDARLRGEAALLALRERLEDVELAAVVREYRELVTDRRVREGLDQLLELAPVVAGEAAGLERVDGLTFGWLRQPANLTRLYARAMQTRRPNSVRRSLHRAVCELLIYRLGRGEMLRVMADVRKPGERDERTAMLAPQEIRAALLAADPEFRPVLGLAVTTGIDRGV